MARPTKSTDPRDRMGVYKCLDDVPDRYRLYHLAATYDGRDIWTEFCEEYEYAQGTHERFAEEVDRAGRRWCRFMQQRDRHHALATPADIEAWSADLLDATPSLRRAYEFWIRIERFYDWLQWHSEYDHRYTPVLMAAAEGGAAGRIWAKKVERHLERRNANE